MDKASEIQSGVYGNATVIFGGRIGGKIGRIKDFNKPHVVLSFDELNANYAVGRNIATTDRNNTQVSLVFDNIKSIEIMKTWLNDVAILLKQSTEDNGVQL